MITLITRDGTRSGNAIIYGFDESKFEPGKSLYLVETDFGNKMRMTAGEVDEYFKLGKPISYAEWSADRQALIMGAPAE